MKKILVVNNYSMKKSLEWSKKNIFPSQHTWGCDELEKEAKLSFFVHTIPPFLHKLHIARIWYYIQNLIILIRAIGCDCIYVAASPLIDLIGFLKYIGWYKKKLVVVVHHQGNFSLRRQRYDKLIFICRAAYDKALVDYPQYRDLFIFQEWGPDLNFYKGVKTDVKDISFISNGITDRDNELLISAAQKTLYNVAILCNQQSIPSNYNEKFHNISLIYNKGSMMNGKILSYSDMIRLVSKYSICVIPTKSGRTTLCGLTSFCDAIALGMPVILSDTTHINVDFKEYPFGCYYRAGDINDLIEKMKYLNDNHFLLNRMSRYALEYAEKINYKHFANVVSREILK